jgi:hypothetical protein
LTREIGDCFRLVGRELADDRFAPPELFFAARFGCARLPVDFFGDDFFADDFLALFAEAFFRADGLLPPPRFIDFFTPFFLAAMSSLTRKFC